MPTFTPSQNAGRVIVFLIDLQEGKVIKRYEGKELMDGYDVTKEAMADLEKYGRQGYALAVGLYYSADE